MKLLLLLNTVIVILTLITLIVVTYTILGQHSGQTVSQPPANVTGRNLMSPTPLEESLTLPRTSQPSADVTGRNPLLATSSENLRTLPKARIATPLPLKMAIIRVDDNTATNRALEYVRSRSIPIEGAAISFIRDEPDHGQLRLTGQLNIWVLGFPAKRGPIVAIADPQIQNERLRFVVRSLTLSGQPVSENEYPADIAQVLNNSFDDLLLGRQIKSVDIVDGEIIVTALEQP